MSIAGDWACALHALLQQRLAAPPCRDVEVPESPAPLLRASGPLQAQYQLHTDSLQEAAQVGGTKGISHNKKTKAKVLRSL